MFGKDHERCFTVMRAFKAMTFFGLESNSEPHLTMFFDSARLTGTKLEIMLPVDYKLEEAERRVQT